MVTVMQFELDCLRKERRKLWQFVDINFVLWFRTVFCINIILHVCAIPTYRVINSNVKWFASNNFLWVWHG